MLRLAGTLLALTLPFPNDLATRRPPSAIAGFEYVSPVPGSRYHPPETNIILRPGGRVDPASLPDDRTIVVNGSRSGRHRGRAAIADDGETITFTPEAPFVRGETVSCRIGSGLATETRGALRPFGLDFTIAGPERAPGSAAALQGAPGTELSLGGPPALAPYAPAWPVTEFHSAATESLPADFPRITRTVYGSPSSGRLFLSNLMFGNESYTSYLMIVDDDGRPVYWKKLAQRGLDWKRQPDGRLTYFDTSVGYYYAMDASYAVVDSFRCGNGYGTDLHDLQLLPNGHALLMSYDPQRVDMSRIVPGGNPAATVVGLVIQELDRAHEVIFQWRSWDHFEITDAADDINLTSPVIDYAHGNAIERDDDGNLLLSSRHMDEITKISRRTGKILWRWGGKQNQFVFLNDPIGFSHQHDIRRLPNGNVTLFDNGNLHRPEFSRAVEYRLDEHRRTATLVWAYRPEPLLIAYAMGSVQRLPSGNTLIGWGSANPTVTEVTPDGVKVSELTFNGGMLSYRAFRHEWPPVLRVRADIVPKVLSLRSSAPHVTVTIEPEEFDPALIDVATVRLAEILPPVPAPGDAPVGAWDERHPPLRLRFPLDSLAPLLTPGWNRLAVTGSVTTGASFRGEVEVRAVPAGPRDQGRPDVRLVSAPGALPVRLRVEGGTPREPVVGVYDVRGRLVARWRAPMDDRGLLVWDGRCRDGEVARSGLYLLRLEGTPAGRAFKILVVR